jgi:hypothetical protein
MRRELAHLAQVQGERFDISPLSWSGAAPVPAPDVPPSTQFSRCHACISPVKGANHWDPVTTAHLSCRESCRERSHFRQGITYLIGHLASAAV